MLRKENKYFATLCLQNKRFLDLIITCCPGLGLFSTFSTEKQECSDILHVIMVCHVYQLLKNLCHFHFYQGSAQRIPSQVFFPISKDYKVAQDILFFKDDHVVTIVPNENGNNLNFSKQTKVGSV